MLQRAQKAMDLALLNMLRDMRPALSADTTYEAAAARLADVPAWQAVADETRRRQVFVAFIDALRKVDDQAHAAAMAGIKVRWQISQKCTSHSEVDKSTTKRKEIKECCSACPSGR